MKVQVERFERSLRTPAAARELAREAAARCADPLRVEWGLLELLMNAIEHGLLAIGHREKCALIDAGRLEAEVADRLAHQSHAAGVVAFAGVLRDGRWHFEIHDPGGGFDPQPWLAASAGDPVRRAGRGILLARSFGLADLGYRDGGRCACCSAPAAC
ncbi:hypothetical protein CJ010_20595 [Azoarcus sp. DD4]|uniref:hypothetical protein n=1 Tax=Azoarcus sp. DD4 TaxID=2027405 RepID=UPI00116553CA|nr:hypothetical protein [Azoarcus sp. DD4]QDF98762.1 hypothetical protein CJ010_20595 [Azoarcus sp. DD4]